jgi:hypothetical protein
MELSPYPIDPDLTAIAVAYKNAGYIADIVLPRVRVGKQKFTFMQYATDTFFNVPDTRVGRRSKPNELVMDGTEVADFCEDFALDGGVPLEDIENSDARYNPLDNEVMLLQEAIALDREARAAAILHTAANFDATLQVTLSGTGQYSDKVNSDPVTGILGYLEQPLMRPTDMTMNTEVWTQLRTHPKMVQAIYGSAATAGIVTKEQVAQLFELQRINVGYSRRNTAKRGQAVSLGRIWGKHIALHYNAPVVDARTVTFGASFQFGDRVASQWEDRNMGMRGGIGVRTGESLRERIIAPQAGYFIQNAVA